MNPKNNPSNAPIGKHGGVPDVGELRSLALREMAEDVLRDKLDLIG